MINAAPAQSLSHQIISLCANINLANYHLLSLIAEFDNNDDGERQGFISTAHWLNYYCGIGLTAAREKVRVALALQRLPAVARCFGKGLVSYSKVRALTRVATKDNEGALLDIARNATAAQAERIFRQYRQTLDNEESSNDDSARVNGRNSFSSHWDEQGNLVFRGQLSPEQGALLLAAMQREQDDGAERDSALASLAQRALSHNAIDETQATSHPANSAERYQIHVELDANTQHIRGGSGITDKIIERLSCDASVVTHHYDADGQPLSVGRKTRTIPPAVRRALVKRDGGCRFPGCTHRRFVDAHHVHHWANGGTTRLSNLVLLCTKHHTALHELGFRIEAVTPSKGATQFRFYDPHNNYLPPVADDLSHGQVLRLYSNASAESRHQSITKSPLAPNNPTPRPDYHHINWLLTNFYPPNGK